MLSISI